jgi:hypothetical protein
MKNQTITLAFACTILVGCNSESQKEIDAKAYTSLSIVASENGVADRFDFLTSDPSKNGLTINIENAERRGSAYFAEATVSSKKTNTCKQFQWEFTPDSDDYNLLFSKNC